MSSMVEESWKAIVFLEIVLFFVLVFLLKDFVVLFDSFSLSLTRTSASSKRAGTLDALIFIGLWLQKVFPIFLPSLIFPSLPSLPASPALFFFKMATLQAMRRCRPTFKSSMTMSRRNLATTATSSSLSTFHPSRLPPYPKLIKNLEKVKSILNRPLTLAEKILYSHLRNPEESLDGVGKNPSDLRGKKYLSLELDRLAMQGECR